MIQKHDATRLHYDLRLELHGVMLSWAVTRGPSFVPDDKRLAIHVEDHPIEYNTFEGTIPKGEYGGGTVMIWDRGTWQPEKDPERVYAKGHLKFRLDGEKLQALVKRVYDIPAPVIANTPKFCVAPSLLNFRRARTLDVLSSQVASTAARPPP